MLGGPRVDGAMVLRATVLSLVITVITAAAHATHGQAPSWTLTFATAGLLTAACLVVSRARLGWRRAVTTMVVGQFALHAWFAWFSMPMVGAGTETLGLHHGPASALLVSRDFSGLVPSPGMALAHLAAGGVAALVLVHMDWLLSAAFSVLRAVLGPTHVPSVFATAALRTPVVGRVKDAESLEVLAHLLVRRGPPAYCG
jgi:hypothetical protein